MGHKEDTLNFSNYTLRPYQVMAVDKAIEEFNKGSQPFILVLPSGSGKSIVIAEICHRLNEPILILQPTKEILEQNYKKLLSYGIMDIGIYSASCNSKQIQKFTYATIGSIYKKPELFSHFKKVLFDECHFYSPENKNGMYNKFFRDIKCESICGLSATPWRNVQKYLNIGGFLTQATQLTVINRIYPFFFKKIAFTISIQHLINEGYLCPLEYKFYNDFDTSNIAINSTGSDYDEEALEKFWDDKKLHQLSLIIKDIDSQCKHNVIFCSSISQAERCSQMLKVLGLSADHVSSKNSKLEREHKLKQFREGKIKHMANCSVLGVGWDFPELDCITLARPTLSFSILSQQIGRGFRMAEGKQRCLIVDITQNVKKFGRIETTRITKESNGFRDIVVTEAGELTGKLISRFTINK